MTDQELWHIFDQEKTQIKLFEHRSPLDEGMRGLETL